MITISGIVNLLKSLGLNAYISRSKKIVEIIIKKNDKSCIIAHRMTLDSPWVIYVDGVAKASYDSPGSAIMHVLEVLGVKYDANKLSFLIQKYIENNPGKMVQLSVFIPKIVLDIVRADRRFANDSEGIRYYLIKGILSEHKSQIFDKLIYNNDDTSRSGWRKNIVVHSIRLTRELETAVRKLAQLFFGGNVSATIRFIVASFFSNHNVKSLEGKY